jgi:bifunctional polynucleotide phosphatase/kinase
MNESLIVLSNKIKKTDTPLDCIIKIASFDLDNTIIFTKSKKIFAIDSDDWAIDIKVLNNLQNLINENYKIIIFTNQGGIKSGKQDKKDWINKCTKIMEYINIPVIIVASIKDDLYRKPRTDMWNYIKTNYYSNIDMTNSFYCGDACGRIKYKNRKADFSCSDYKFALNLNITFYTPEQLFYNSQLDIDIDICYRYLGFEPKKYLTNTDDSEIQIMLNNISNFNRKLILLIGPMAAGKSTFYNNYLSAQDTYKLINQDQLKTIAKCKAEFKNLINQKNYNIVIDNCNKDIKTREIWKELAKKNNLELIYIVLDIPKEMSLHLNTYRSLTSSKHIPKIAIHSYYKNYEEPTNTECNNIFKIPFILNNKFDIKLLQYLM